MSRLSKSNVHAPIDRAIDRLIEAGGPDQRVSRANFRAALAALDGAPAAERDLMASVYTFADRKYAAGRGAQVTRAKLERVREYAKRELVNKYDLNHNGLSKSERAELSKHTRIGRLAVKLAQMAKGEVAPPAPPPVSPNPAEPARDRRAIVELATRFVNDNVGEGYFGDPPSLFPQPDSGNGGLSAFLASDAQGPQLVALAKALAPGLEDVQAFELDPARQAVVAVVTSDDEEVIHVSVLDRVTGAATYLTDVNLIDVAYGLEPEVFGRFFPGLDPEEAGSYELIELLARGGDEVVVAPSIALLREQNEIYDNVEAGPILEVVNGIDERWGDENISSSSIRANPGRLFAGRDLSDGQLEVSATTLLERALTRDGSPRTPGTPLEVTVEPASQAVLRAIADHVSLEGFQYSPRNREGLGAIRKDVADMARALGKPADLAVVTARATADSDVLGEPTPAIMSLIVNRESGAFSSVYVLTGAM